MSNLRMQSLYVEPRVFSNVRASRLADTSPYTRSLLRVTRMKMEKRRTRTTKRMKRMTTRMLRKQMRKQLRRRRMRKKTKMTQNSGMIARQTRVLRMDMR